MEKSLADARERQPPFQWNIHKLFVASFFPFQVFALFIYDLTKLTESEAQICVKLGQQESPTTPWLQKPPENPGSCPAKIRVG